VSSTPTSSEEVRGPFTRQQLESEISRLQGETASLVARSNTTAALISSLKDEKLQLSKDAALVGGTFGTVSRKQAEITEAEDKLTALHALISERKTAIANAQATLADLQRIEEAEQRRVETEATTADATRLADEVLAGWERLAYLLGDLTLQIQRLFALDQAAATRISEKISRPPRHAQTLTLEAIDRGCCAVMAPSSATFGDGVIVPSLLRPSRAFAGSGIDLWVGVSAAKALELLATLAQDEAKGEAEAQGAA
jgi:hypothetical protein